MKRNLVLSSCCSWTSEKHQDLSNYRIACYFPYGCKFFLNGEILTSAEIFPIYNFTSLTTEKSDMSDVSYKVYLGRTVICPTFAMCTVIIVL